MTEVEMGPSHPFDKATLPGSAATEAVASVVQGRPTMQQEVETTYRARIRFHCAPDTRFNIDSATHSFGDGFTLKTPDGDSPIRESEWLVLEIGGLSSEAEAREQGQRAKDALVWAGLCCKKGVDVGKDKVTSSVSNHIRDKLFKETGVRIRASVHGLDVFDESVSTRTFVFSATGTVVSSLEPFVASFQRALQDDVRITDERQEVACAVYHSAHYQSSARAKLLMLVSAVEVLAESPKLGGRADHLRALLGWVTRIGGRLLGVPRGESESLGTALTGARRLSVRQSCKRLIELHLPIRQYDSRSAFKFFDAVYGIRSAITHSGGGDVDEAEVQRVNPTLDQFVSDLIQAHIRGNGSPPAS